MATLNFNKFMQELEGFVAYVANFNDPNASKEAFKWVETLVEGSNAFSQQERTTIKDFIYAAETNPFSQRPTWFKGKQPAPWWDEAQAEGNLSPGTAPPPGWWENGKALGSARIRPGGPPVRPPGGPIGPAPPPGGGQFDTIFEKFNPPGGEISRLPPGSSPLGPGDSTSVPPTGPSSMIPGSPDGMIPGSPDRPEPAPPAGLPPTGLPIPMPGGPGGGASPLPPGVSPYEWLENALLKVLQS